MIVGLLTFFHLTIASNVTVDRIPRTGSPPVRRLYASSVYLDGKIYYYGGRNHSGNSINDFHSFDINSEIWEKLEPVDEIKPLARITFAMYKSDSAIFVHGGHGPNGILNDLWSYEVSLHVWKLSEQLGDVPPPFYRSGHTDFTFNGIQYFALSCFRTQGVNITSSDELYLFDNTTKIWRKMPKVAKSGHFVPTARNLWNINYHNGYIYLWGGNLFEDNAGAQLHRYNLSSEEWENITVIGSLPNTRYLFNSGIYNDALYIFPGWHDVWFVDVDETFRIDLTQLEHPDSAVWEELQIEKIAGYDNYLPRDSYAGIMVENQLYMHGGYGDLTPIGNFLIKLDVDQSPIGLIVINKDMDIPENRYFATLTLIAGKFYMFGGSTGSTVLDDLRVYDENEDTWTLQDTTGHGPGPRQGHSAAAIGSSLLIWGGKNGSEFYDDLYLYNTITNIWELVEIKSKTNPIAAEGSCMEVYNDDLYLFGGKNEFHAINTLWKFSLGSNEYTQLSDNNYQSPNAVAYSTCYAISNKLYMAYGVLDNTDSPSQITIWDPKLHEWTISSLVTANRRAYIASAKAGASIISINGSTWENWAHDDITIINTETGNAEHTMELPWKTFAEASQYHKNSLYVFGGGDSLLDGAVRETRTIDRFYKITFPDMPCSVGTYLSDNEWISCPKGTYKDTDGSDICIQCPRGTYNEKEAAAHISQCLPCPQGTFNSALGKTFWVKCYSSSQYWPVGSIEPREAKNPDNQFVDTQPGSHESLEWKAKQYTETSLIYLIVCGVLILLTVIFVPDLALKIPTWDSFHDMHNHIPGQIMKTRETFLGGMATIIFYGVAIFLIIQALLYYFYDNIEEVKSLVPIIIVKEFTDSITGTINIKMHFGEYGGLCVTEENQCSPEITYTTSEISGRLSELKCESKEQVWVLQLTCEECILDPSAEVMFSSYEHGSYATSIKVEVSSQSSIPSEISQIEYNMFVKNGEILRGPDPTIFNFQAVPSVYQSENDTEDELETGYHLDLQASSIQGSSYTVENISKTRNIHAKIKFDQGYSALKTTRSYKIRTDVLFMTIIGGLAGMMELVTIAMGKIEEKYEARLEKYKKQESHKRTFNLSRKLTSYFDDFDASMLNRHVGAVIQGIRVEDADKSDPEKIFDDSTTNLTMHPISGDPFVTGIAPSGHSSNSSIDSNHNLMRISHSPPCSPIKESDEYRCEVEFSEENYDNHPQSSENVSRWAKYTNILATNPVETDFANF